MLKKFTAVLLSLVIFYANCSSQVFFYALFVAIDFLLTHPYYAQVSEARVNNH